ncbi:hypothetical protein T484DRAFT_1644991 [Baffinella frigidus]|nr:hypothetical protein T484DRAFT_1644991 [Cryptophyta sp. CCMP2293]
MATAETAYEQTCTAVASYLDTDSGDCVPCWSVGYFTDSTNGDECTSCPVATSCAVGSDAIEDCECVVGYTAVSNGVECTACSEATYKHTTGTAACTACPSGTSSVAGSDEETDCKCMAGFEAGADGVVCTACAAGTYKETVGTGTCAACPLRTTSVAGSGDLIDCKCVVGYTATTDGEECTACSAGSYKLTTGTGSCVGVCPTGTSSEPGSDELTDCKCNTGYTAGSDGIACSPCGAGNYKDVAGAVGCQPCPLKTSSASGSSSLSNCVCIVGYTALSNGTDCTICEAGTYKNVTGAVECATCPSGTSSTAGTTMVTGCACLGGYVGSAGAACTMCPEDTYCVGGVLTNCPPNGYAEAGSDELVDCVCGTGYFR